jgi:hypothetical protein
MPMQQETTCFLKTISVIGIRVTLGVKAQVFCALFTAIRQPNLGYPFNPNHSSAQPHLQDPRAIENLCLQKLGPALPEASQMLCR